MNFWDLPYIRWHIIFVLIPTVVLWIMYGGYFLKYKKTFMVITIGSMIWGFWFDQVASVTHHLWFFNETKNLGIWFLGLPIEEYMFLIFVPQGLVGVFLLMRRRIYGRK